MAIQSLYFLWPSHTAAPWNSAHKMALYHPRVAWPGRSRARPGWPVWAASAVWWGRPARSHKRSLGAQPGMRCLGGRPARTILNMFINFLLRGWPARPVQIGGVAWGRPAQSWDRAGRPQAAQATHWPCDWGIMSECNLYVIKFLKQAWENRKGILFKWSYIL